MLRILDTPVLELLIDQLRRHGIDQIMINTAHHAEAIEQYFGDGTRFGVSIAYSFEGYREGGELVGEPLGSAGALRRIQEHSGFFDDTFVVLCGDAIIDLDFSALVEAHHRKAAIATLALKEVARAETVHYGVAVLDEECRISQFQEKPAPEAAMSTLANTGIYVFEPEIFRHIPETTPHDLGSQVFPDLAARGMAIYGASVPLTWLDIGRLDDYYRVCQQAIRGEVPGLLPPGREIAPGIRAGLNVSINLRRCEVEGPVIIAGSATVEDGATIIGPAYIGAGAVVERGARVERSVVLAHARVGGHADLIEVISDGRYCITADGTVIDLELADLPWLVTDARVPKSNLAVAEQRFVSTLQ
jgi:mannose-1-phosphate guanylyltransferase